LEQFQKNVNFLTFGMGKDAFFTSKDAPVVQFGQIAHVLQPAPVLQIVLNLLLANAYLYLKNAHQN